MIRPWFDSRNIVKRFEARRTAVLQALHGGPSTCEHIAAAIGSHKRTVYREIQALRDKGAPIRSTPGRGYVLEAQR